MNGVVVLFFGALALVMGVVFAGIGWQSRQNAIRVAELPQWTAADIGEESAGLEGMVEGVLSEDNEMLAGGFVLYYRSRLSGFKKEDSGKRPQWRSIDRQLPALQLETNDGKVWVFGDYSVTFKGSDRTWLSTETLEVGTTDRYEGLEAGQTVTAVGRVAEGPMGWGLEIESLASGKAQEILAGERGGAKFASIAGGVLLLVGGVLVAVGIGILS